MMVMIDGSSRWWMGEGRYRFSGLTLTSYNVQRGRNDESNFDTFGGRPGGTRGEVAGKGIPRYHPVGSIK